jgi:O-antigen ligase
VLLVVTILEILIIQNAFAPGRLPDRIERDNESLQARLQIWQSALHIIGNYPLTGVGMNMFRDGRVREAYPVPIYESSILPRAHNEILQITTDLGLPGLAFFISVHGVIAWMLIHVYRHSDELARSVAVGVGAGLLGHVWFGLGDAIPLWDRFAFIWWGLLALACATYTLLKLNRSVR